LTVLNRVVKKVGEYMAERVFPVLIIIMYCRFNCVKRSCNGILRPQTAASYHLII